MIIVIITSIRRHLGPKDRPPNRQSATGGKRGPVPKIGMDQDRVNVSTMNVNSNEKLEG